ncbi:protein XNDC1N isoform X1 [Cygnus atratus]|uniref:protein XNDC1N isoform X1 n=1 Tax=Cygnus atratus TaxID=8868 RepID=UPI0015D60D5A|nr:protein XNDC1N isoform X1 [Cygnus atratus]
MAPVRISFVVSFSSQDPRYPVENLLRGDGRRPWLSCPQDRSRQLRAELQLERASAIGYVDVGNCGCAFVQVEVGRSSWPLGQPYVPLVPSVTLMTPAESRTGENRCGVRMFKEADFLALAVGQKWDRLRLTCSQPFSRRGQFGLSFLRLRTPIDPEPDPRPAPEGAELTDSPWRCSPAFCRTLSPEPRSSSREEEQLRSRLQQLEPGTASHAWSPARLSRPARMVLSAARSRAMKPRASTSTPGSSPELPAEDRGGPAAPGSTQDAPAPPKRVRRQPGSRQRAHSPAGRALPAPPGKPSAGGRARAQARGRSEGQARAGGSGGESSGGEEVGLCPICSGCFSMALLPAHASRCGEDDSDSDVEQPSSPGAWVPCPICELRFSPAEVERHASTCGE